MSRAMHAERYGVVVATSGEIRCWRQTSTTSVHSLPRNRASGLHLVAYSLVPATIGLYALALDLVTDATGQCRPSGELVQATIRNVVPALMRAGATGVRASCVRMWLSWGVVTPGMVAGEG